MVSEIDNLKSSHSQEGRRLYSKEVQQHNPKNRTTSDRKSQYELLIKPKKSKGYEEN